MVPLPQLMKWFSLDMFKRRLDPDYITKSGQYSGDFVKPLLEMGKTGPYWMGFHQPEASDGPLSIDSSLGALLDDDKGKAILETHLPGISTMPELDQAKGMSLKALAPMSEGWISDQILEAIAKDLGKL